MKAIKIILITIVSAIFLWLILETGLRLYVELPLKQDFYGSITREEVRSKQVKYGIKAVTGAGWLHLGWIADPEKETYVIEHKSSDTWVKIGEAQFGSFMCRDISGRFRVIANAIRERMTRIVGEVSATKSNYVAPIYKPRLDGTWKLLFKPSLHGYYINDHTVFHDARGNWRIIGITHKSDGNFNEEKFFAVGTASSFPPDKGMSEIEPVADFGQLAWAPHVITENGTYHMFWSPHRLERMTSHDGINWDDQKTIMIAPYNRFFRDGMIYKVADGQYLLYTTARSQFFSQVDIYQSFDLEGWQYIGSALQSSCGSERNSPFASTESPFVLQYKGRYYLSITYNNDTFFWNGILLPFKIWIDRASYNETLIFQSDNPYDFGVYQGKSNSSSLVTVLQAHAPEYVYIEDRDQWYITTAGWPWVTTLTAGEAAYAGLIWDPLK